jgi:hypothetical protein
MRKRSLLLTASLALAGALAIPVAATAMAANAPRPSIEYTAFIFLFPWMGPVTETLDPIDVNSIDILFDTIEDPDANDNPAHG